MTETTNANETQELEENEIPISDLPLKVTAYEDEKGFALVLTSEDARIGDSTGRLVKNFLVRIVRGPVPKVTGTHAVAINKNLTRTVEVADAGIDEAGNMFITDATTGEKYRAADLG
jgi:hypothetical protein